MHLRVIHDKAMRPLDALQSRRHGFTVNVHPAGSSGRQEVSVSHSGAQLTGTASKNVFGGRVSVGLCFLLVYFFHLLVDLGTFSMSNVLAGLPETQILRW